MVEREKMLNVRMSEAELLRIQKTAAHLGMTQSDLVRALLVGQDRIVVRAWWIKDKNRQAQLRSLDEFLDGNIHHHFLLDRIGGAADGSIECRVFGRKMGVWRAQALRDDRHTLNYETIELGRFVLEGSPHMWRVVMSLADAKADGQLVLRLAPDLGDG